MLANPLPVRHFVVVVVHAVTPGMLGPPAVQLGVGLSEVPVVPAGRVKA